MQKFVVTIDTEEDMPRFGSVQSQKTTFKNIQAIPRFQELCDKYNIKPTYLVVYPLTKDKKAVNILKTIQKQGRCEIGAHLHPWVTPPIEEEIHDENTHAVNLPPDLVRYKLKNLTQILVKLKIYHLNRLFPLLQWQKKLNYTSNF